MKNTAFTDKGDCYYNIDKHRTVSLIPQGPNVILDLGCATGQLGRKLRELNKASELVGVEIYEAVAKEAEQYYDKVYCGDIESLKLNYKGYFDFVICGDILEHLRDPWSMSDNIYGWLKKNGVLISTIPNIRYWRVIRDLLVFGKWEYVEAGIMDKTHMRFFTRKTFIKLLKKSNFDIHKEIWIVNGRKQNFFNKITFRMLEEFMGSQILVVAVKMDG